MEIKEITDNLKIKIKEAKKISGLNSKHFGFKNWHTTTLNLLRNLPSNYLSHINDFKKLAFEDTKFHRGNRYFSQTDNTKYREDLESAIIIFKKIIDSDKPEKPKSAAGTAAKNILPKDKKKSVATPSKSAKRPKKPKGVRSPAKAGRAPGRKRKPKK